MSSTRITLALALSLVGCTGNFDESLYMTDAGPPEVDAAVTLGLTGEVANLCGADAPLLVFPEGAQQFIFDVDTNGASDTTREVSACTGRSQGGPEVFIAVDAVTDEHWHFHVDVDPFDGRATANPSVYVLRDCDERACSVGDGLDLCSAGSDEHFTFIPSASDRYVVGFDSPSDAFQGRVLAFRTVCGDGQQDHSENCDDGNTESGDGCSADCLSELTPGSPTEIEVNDDIYSANLVDVTGGPFTVRASLDKTCESDVFAVVVPAGGGSIRASLAGNGGTACPSDLASTQLELIERPARGPSLRGTGTIATGDVCPSLGAENAFANDLAAGTYYVAVSVARDRPDTLAYELTLSVE